MKEGGALSIVDSEPEESSCSTAIALNILDEERPVAAGEFKGNAAIVTLGCAKNQVDSEIMLGVLQQSGFRIVADIANADVAIVNTCSFLQSAVEESIDAILDVSEHKQSGRLRKLIVAGCAVNRYREELVESLPEVDSFLTLDDLLKAGEVADSEAPELFKGAERPYFLYDESMPRVLSTGSHTAYVKVSEGCNRPCTFCIIPGIRGKLRSRTPDSVLGEVKALGDAGIKEVNLVAQDLTSYGNDLRSEGLAPLLHTLNNRTSVPWIRLLYAYPIGIDDALLDSIIELPAVCNYLDLPLQHASEAVLKRMKRPVGRYSPRSITEYIKGRQPGIHMRTTFIVGFPGETESDIQDLENFVREGHFSSVGVFTYSPEPGTPASEMEDQVSDAEKELRRERIMLAQQEVLSERLPAFIGQNLTVLLEGAHEETDLLLSSRAEFQAPDVDGIVIINDTGDLALSQTSGIFAEVEITDTAGYDLIGTLKNLRK